MFHASQYFLWSIQSYIISFKLWLVSYAHIIGNAWDAICSQWITVLCYFGKNNLMPVISCLTSLTFWSLFDVICILLCPKTRLGPKFLRNNSLCISLVRQIGFPIHYISVAHCCPLVLIENITHNYKEQVIFKYNDWHYVIFTNMTQYCYSLDC